MFTVALLPFIISSCMELNNFEQTVEIKKHEWSTAQPAEVSFHITDTVSTYHVLVVLRHTEAYAYKNIWLNVATQLPGDSIYRRERFELTLQQPDGTWLGTGLNDIWEVRYPLFTNIRFTKEGIYHIQLQQAMRDEPLLHIMNAGVRIEKVLR
ncbi:MAG TPA: gliding motility lipoprotein GldH [Lacibacter sp.]|nr:gliding motility lipoprotein GldH [Lacibacter sp.]